MADPNEDRTLEQRFQALQDKHLDVLLPKPPRHSPGASHQTTNPGPATGSNSTGAAGSKNPGPSSSKTNQGPTTGQNPENGSGGHPGPEDDGTDDDDDPDNPHPGTLQDPYTKIFSETAIKAREDAVKGVGPRIAVPHWRDMNKPPKPPAFPRREGKSAMICVGFLTANLRVRQKNPQDPERPWNAAPTDAQAEENRRRGDAVWLRMVNNQPFAPSWSFVDDGGRFVHLEKVTLKEAFRGDNQAAALRKAEHEVARLYYLEFEQRIAAYERNVAIYLERARLFIAWAPTADAEVIKFRNKDQAVAELLAELKKADENYQEWNLDRLSSDLRGRSETYRRELALKRVTMVDNRIDDADKLNSEITNMPSIEHCRSDVFENGINEWNKDRMEQIRAAHSVSGNAAASAAYLLLAIDKAMTTNSFQGHAVSGVILMELSALRGWDKETLVKKRPNLATRCKKVWW